MALTRWRVRAAHAHKLDLIIIWHDDHIVVVVDGDNLAAGRIPAGGVNVIVVKEVDVYDFGRSSLRRIIMLHKCWALDDGGHGGRRARRRGGCMKVSRRHLLEPRSNTRTRVAATRATMTRSRWGRQTPILLELNRLDHDERCIAAHNTDRACRLTILWVLLGSMVKRNL